ncbi:acyl-CoA N-acyltransferase [Auriscalpium vulgare]|uniref:Acyl-CoA N-acyltransferase n=1 Tax=Auriscalpium vulgare TaxID=40419 RepID=A0ACB8S2A8_9AGAM|nr:acyl-CoA N-acyltransferase [Auriscalpium vulgare]
MFRSGRFYLRKYRDSDRKHLADLWTDAEIQALIFLEYAHPGPRRDKFVQDTIAEWTRAPSLLGVVEDGWTGAFVGHVGLLTLSPAARDGRVSIALRKEWWGRGVGTELMQWLVAHGFRELGMRRISLMVLADNARALALYRQM